ncbi:thioredoxin [Simiduia agarivorans SA1 = DSM 21679]|uniref:Thioredoxin n=2 Tax=Simiduia TaxID=447467 RepID=K4KIW6_SIMAS|nr:thioredoxin [Simiduia agarivorans SA1 = DSM 21679]
MENAQSVLIDASSERPVLIDFWADWCEPCKSLAPILDSIAKEYQGRFLLAKVNADELGPIAGQLGVRSLPTLILMKQGQPVDGLVGVQSAQSIRAMLDKYVTPAWKDDWLSAKQLMADDSKWVEALALFKAAWDASGDPLVAADYADALAESRQLDAAESLLAQVKLEDRGGAWQSAQAKIALKREAGKSPAIVALEQALEADPENLALTQQLAVALAEDQHPDEALALLFGLLQKNINAGDGAVKKCFTDIIASLGKGHAIGVQYQRRLYTLLY